MGSFGSITASISDVNGLYVIGMLTVLCPNKMNNIIDLDKVRLDKVWFKLSFRAYSKNVLCPWTKDGLDKVRSAIC